MRESDVTHEHASAVTLDRPAGFPPPEVHENAGVSGFGLAGSGGAAPDGGAVGSDEPAENPSEGTRIDTADGAFPAEDTSR